MFKKHIYIAFIVLLTNCSQSQNNAALSDLDNPEVADSEVKRTAVIGYAKKYLGTTYHYAGVDPATGFVIDLKKLKDIIFEHVISKVDHKNLNIDTDFMKGLNPTSENIVVAIWNQLKDKIPSGKLFSVKLYETENNYFEYRGE